MKRECLLSGAYLGEPMKIKGVELHYSPLVNETVRLLKCSFIASGTPGQSDHAGLVECAMVMYWLETGDKAAIKAHIKKTPEERSEAVFEFYLENEGEVESVKQGLIERMASAYAASVEVQSVGKPTEAATQAASPQ